MSPARRPALPDHGPGPGSGSRVLSVLGSTGSIGVSALDVVRRLNRRRPVFRVAGLAAGNNESLLRRQIEEFRPRWATLESREAAARLAAWARDRSLRVEIDHGPAALESLAGRRGVDVVLCAVVGARGLRALLAAVGTGRRVALANKESLVVAGEAVMAAARRSGAEIVPVDSEHSAMFQCLDGRTGRAAGVRRLILTASGGAFYNRRGPLDRVTPAEALAHPTWTMGRKITVDSATLTNKGLEAIEAHHLFGVPMDRIEIVIHPQSIVHSLVEFDDGSVLAQLSEPDMRLPIQYALTFPDRQPGPVRRLDLPAVGRLDFQRPDFRRFPCLDLALKVGRRGGTWPAAFNAANEAAVAGFLDGRLSFTGIAKVIRRVLRAQEASAGPARSVDAVEAAGREARALAEGLIAGQRRKR